MYDNKYSNIELAIPRNIDGNNCFWTESSLRYTGELPIGKANDNPILDTHMYEVEYLDGHKESLDKNYIVENMFALVDSDGNRYVLFEEIIYHHNGISEVKQKDSFI